ncbi:MAG: acyltransferase family protein [Chthoniobacteraceae bacterium]
MSAIISPRPETPPAVALPDTVVAQVPARLMSLDAYRGAIMVLMASGGLGLAKVAQSHPDSPVWRFIGYHTEHAEWVGCTLWDLIQPAFMFMVGIALPWSIANRQARGQSFGSMFGHALWRSLLLVLLGVFLTSAWSKQTDWAFVNVLSQIGLGYPLLFLLAFLKDRIVWSAGAALLIGYWLAFALHPLPPNGFDWASVGLPPDWAHLTGFAAHWEKHVNFAASFDRWLLNLFPRSTPFTFNSGGYATLNFIPSLATMIFGLIAGRLLRSDLPMQAKLNRLVIAGATAIVFGLLLGATGICPIVKRIWSPSFALYSAGWVAMLLAAFVAVVDWKGWKRWALPLVIEGLNPIALYMMWQLSSRFIRQQVQIHFGQEIFASFGAAWVSTLERATVLLILWLIVWWMYRRKIFLRI